MLLRNTTVLWRELDGEAILLNPKEGCSYNLNNVGTLIWKMLDGEHTPDEIARTVCELYDVEYAQALHDVERLLAELLDNKLLSDGVPPSRTTV
jgi:Coenzyme PQQ synthesis protein D (PqqD)